MDTFSRWSGCAERESSRGRKKEREGGRERREVQERGGKMRDKLLFDFAKSAMLFAKENKLHWED